MGHTTVSECHSLRIYRLGQVDLFARMDDRVALETQGESLDIGLVLGSVTAVSETKNGLIGKKISFETVSANYNLLRDLEMLKASKLVAVYTDGYGNERVCGSPDYPLSLQFDAGRHGYDVVLAGTDTSQDGFLIP